MIAIMRFYSGLPQLLNICRKTQIAVESLQAFTFQVCSGHLCQRGFLPFLLMSSSLRLTKLAMVVGRLDRSLSGMLSFFKAWQLKSCYGNTEGKQWNIIVCWKNHTETFRRKVQKDRERESQLEACTT